VVLPGKQILVPSMTTLRFAPCGSYRLGRAEAAQHMTKDRQAPEPAEKAGTRLDDAARAGWLYYVAGNTQDEIARKLSISRQSAQRLVALAVSHRLVKVRIDHPIAACMELAKALTERFGLLYCDVTPSDPDNHSTTLGIANAAAAEIERWLARTEPTVIGMGTGEEMRATALQIKPMDCPQHKLVSLVGNIAPDGSASLLDSVSRAADMVKAPHFPMPCPVIAASPAERDKIMAQSHVRQALALARAADVTFVGVGSMVEDAPLVKDGFVSLAEMRAMMAVGSAGEIAGWAYDDAGAFIKGLTNDRATGVRPQHDSSRPVIGVSMEPGRLRAIRAALAGRLLNGLITNEDMARRLAA
jgi:DNA-binding transcriptional regulator LsrR (DeoR family)